MALPASRPLQQITVADIGAFVVAVIERSDTVFGRRFDIAGDELTGDQAAAILSKVTGREIRYEGFRQRSYVPRAKIWLGCSAGSIAQGMPPTSRTCAAISQR